MTLIDKLTDALRSVVSDIEEYERINNLSPSPGKSDCWQSVTNARAALAEAERVKGENAQEHEASMIEIANLRDTIERLERELAEARGIKAMRQQYPAYVVGQVTGQMHLGDQVPGMPHAICHACGLGEPCGNPDCPNRKDTPDEIEKVARIAEPDVWTAIDDVGVSPSDRSRWREASMRRAAGWVAAYRAALEADGYVIVPSGATEEMVNAARGLSRIRDAYRAMIAAAPKG